MRLFRALPAFSAVALAATVTLALTGCASSPASPAGAGSGAGVTSSGGSAIQVIASTNVYGDIVSQIGGTAVSVTSIIDDPSKDPHEYEANAQNQLSISKAQLVVENGGGYDDFVDTMLSASGNTQATVLNAATLSGYNLTPADGEFNEHLWYDFPTVSKVADAIASSLSAIDAAGASTFQANATAFKQKVSDLQATEQTLKPTLEGQGVAITEPVPLYMLDAVGLVNKTPEKFSEAIENDTDVAPDVLAETVALFTSGQVTALVYNEQTTGAQTEAVLSAAKAANAAVVPVTETLPSGLSYLDWMAQNLQALKSAYAK